jgi:hypothetical protein
MTFFSTDTGKVFHCTDGSANTWVEISTFSGPLEITDDLTVTGDLILPTGIIEVSDGAGTMDVYTHALRHNAAGDDPISGLVNQVLVGADDGSSPITLTASYQDIVSVAIDTGGRDDPSSILIFGICQCFNTNSGTSARVSFRLALNTDGGGAVAYTPPEALTATLDVRAGSNQDNFVMNLQGFDPALIADQHVITMQARISDGFGAAETLARQLFVIDLGSN